MCRTTIYTGITVDTLALVDDRQGLSHGDGTLRTGTYTFLTADASDTTVLTGSGAWPFILTADGNRRRDGHELKQFLRADLYALATAMALSAVHRDDAI